jgi:hypothetical protein
LYHELRPLPFTSGTDRRPPLFCRAKVPSRKALFPLEGVPADPAGPRKARQSRRQWSPGSHSASRRAGTRTRIAAGQSPPASAGAEYPENAFDARAVTAARPARARSRPPFRQQGRHDCPLRLGKEHHGDTRATKGAPNLAPRLGRVCKVHHSGRKVPRGAQVLTCASRASRDTDPWSSGCARPPGPRD